MTFKPLFSKNKVRNLFDCCYNAHISIQSCKFTHNISTLSHQSVTRLWEYIFFQLFGKSTNFSQQIRIGIFSVDQNVLKSKCMTRLIRAAKVGKLKRLLAGISRKGLFRHFFSNSNSHTSRICMNLPRPKKKEFFQSFSKIENPSDRSKPNAFTRFESSSSSAQFLRIPRSLSLKFDVDCVKTRLLFGFWRRRHFDFPSNFMSLPRRRRRLCQNVDPDEGQQNISKLLFPTFFRKLKSLCLSQFVAPLTMLLFTFEVDFL